MFIQEARRNKFEEFYLSMIKDNYGDPAFEIRNYIYRDEIPTLTEQDVFKDIGKNIAKEIQKVKEMFVNIEEGKKEPAPVDLKVISGDYELPKNILREGDTFRQTNSGFNSPNMCLFNTELSKWCNKMRVQVVSLQGKVTFGVVRRE